MEESNGVLTAIQCLAVKRGEVIQRLERLDRIIASLKELNDVGAAAIDKAVGNAVAAPDAPTQTTPGRITPEDRKTIVVMLKGDKAAAQIVRHFNGRYNLQQIYNLKYSLKKG